MRESLPFILMPMRWSNLNSVSRKLDSRTVPGNNPAQFNPTLPSPSSGVGHPQEADEELRTALGLKFLRQTLLGHVGQVKATQPNA